MAESLTDHYEAFSPTSRRLELTVYEVSYMLPVLQRELQKIRGALQEGRPSIFVGTYEEAEATWIGIIQKFEQFSAERKAALKSKEDF